MLERLAIGFLVGVFGFLTGMLVWWAFAGIPGFSLRLFFPVSLGLGAVCFLLGLWRPDETMGVLTFIGRSIWRFSLEVLSWFRFLR